MINFNEITLKNNAMFNIVMRRPNLCKMCLERILNKKIKDISYPESEKTYDFDLGAKSIRLDIYCEGEEAAYNIELQNGVYEELPKRCRYYQNLIDIDLLDKGQEYSDLKNNIVIFICTFDCFGQGRHLYTFENLCIQDRELSLGDCTTKIFLNTKGIMDDIPVPLKNFLDYLDSGEVSDEYTKQLEDTVIEVRKDKKWRNMIMTVEQLIKDESKLAKKEGIKEGKKEGMDLINELNSRLLQDERLDDLKASITDTEYRMKLFKEYGINIDE